MAPGEGADALWEGRESLTSGANVREVRLACWLCAARYASVVNPHCVLCLGEGVLAAPVPLGIKPIVAARAASLDIEHSLAAAERVPGRRAAGRLVPNSERARGVEGTSSEEERAAIGRFARALLQGKPLPPRAWSINDGTRRAVVAELVAMASEFDAREQTP